MSPIRPCGAPSPTFCGASAPTSRLSAASSPKPPRSGKTRRWRVAEFLPELDAPVIACDTRRRDGGGIFMPTYDDANIFAKILRGEIPAYKVYEDEKSLAFLDIMPRSPGHPLVIPKRKAPNILDVAPGDLAPLNKVTQKIARAAVRTFDAEGVTIHQFNESAGGQVVFHLHVHVIPQKAGVALKPPASQREQPEVLAEHAKRPNA